MLNVIVCTTFNNLLEYGDSVSQQQCVENVDARANKINKLKPVTQ